jgi:serine/threonine protein kinase/predicted Zn-dependent protease
MIGETILHYKILEKLGEGGMGIVYLAEDTKLKRNVAIKFLPKHIAANTEERQRFEVEAQAAASLNHPNIATIHAIEQADDQSFLVMEYVDGETIKKFVEQDAKSFTVKKVLEVAIQVCEGLNAAHEKGIVHRDIKSDNIMLTRKGQVKIMDFGLAKVKGGTKLTAVGSTVGTAAYMSPEQAQGEDVDIRSDIFSFGVVLYEMLTTRLPFDAEHQAALIYSLVNENPQPIARFNDKVSQKLEDIVFKSLEKDRDERYQHIDDMLADLRREKKNIEYAKSGYVKTTTAESAVSGSNKEAGSLQKKFEIKKLPLKILFPALAVIILVAAFFISNPFKTNENQNMATSSTGNSLAVMYFQNIPDPADKNHTGDMLTNLLITSLSQVKGLDVISRDRLLEIEKDLGQTNTKELSPSLSIKIAKQAGVTTMLTGNILQMEPKLAVTTNLVNVQTGKVIGSQQLTNFTESQIFNLVDSLSLLIRNDLEAGTPSSSETKSVAEVTTNSPEAYRAYIEGLNLRDKLFWKEANSAFERAVNLDPNFAMAYYRLSGTQSTLGETEDSQRSLQKAFDLSDKTTERERLQILADHYGVQNNYQKEIETLNKIIKLYPLETTPYISLGFGYYDHFLFDNQKGTAVLREGVKANPNAKTVWNVLSYSYAYLGNKQNAINAVDKYVQLAPAEPNPYDTKGDIYAWFMDYDSSRAAYEYSTSLRNDFDAYKIGSYDLLNQRYNDAERHFQMSGYAIGLGGAGGVTSRFPLPLIEIEKGQIKNAENKLIYLLNSKLSPAEREFVLLQLIHLCYESSQYSGMLKYAKEVSSELHKDPTDKIYGRDYIAWALVKNGESSDANNLIDKIYGDVNNNIPLFQLQADYTSAVVAVEEGKYNVSLQKFRKVVNALPPNHEPNIFYAISLLKSGQTADAEKELNRLLYWSGSTDIYLVGIIPGEITYWPIQSVKARYWLGVAYEQQGKKEKAISEYKKFLDIWKDADFNSPEINDAKVRLAKLK